MNPKIIGAAAIGAVVLTVAGVSLAIGEKGVAVVLIRTDATRAYAYKERIVTSATAEKGGDFLQGAVMAGETLVEVTSLAPCIGGNEARCLAGDERPVVAPCVRAIGADCFRTSPGRPRRFFGLNNTFLASESTGTQCQAVACVVIAGDAPR
jgi:hypothetical protein